jgi:hypothetical protein
MEYSEKNLTLLVPVYNTSKKFFMEHYKSIMQFPEMKKIYWDDGITCEDTKNILYDLIAKLPNVSIFKNQENMGQEYTVYCLAQSEEISTDYIIRVDADDSLKVLPIGDSNVFDILLLKKASINLEWLLEEGGSLNSSIFKRELFKNLTEDHKNLRKFSQWIHEDVWYSLNLFVPIYKNKITLNIINNIGGQRVIVRGIHDLQITTRKVTSRKLKRFDTFLIWSIEHNDFDIYYELTAKINGYDETMSMRRTKLGIK